jgi:hypothetical protein
VSDLLTLWRSEPIHSVDHKGDFTLVLARLPLAGGNLAELARATLPGPDYHTEHGKIVGFRITSLLPTPQGIFIADFLRGILVARDGKISAWTAKEGLASDEIWSLGWGNDTLYAGADNGFMSIDPKTGQCKTLASSKSVASGNPLNGGTAYRIANILSSPDGKSLWLAVGGDDSRLGVWRYDLAGGTFDHVVHTLFPEPQLRAGGPSMTWHDGKLMIFNVRGDAFHDGLFDPNSGALVEHYQNAVATLPTDMVFDERTGKDLSVIAYPSQNGVVFTPRGFVKADRTLFPFPGESGPWIFHIDNSFIATPALDREWQSVQEAGPGFVAAIYDAPQYLKTRPGPALWYFTPPRQAQTQPATTPQGAAPAKP